MGGEDVGVGEKRHRFGLAAEGVEIGSGAVEVDGLDGDDGRVDGGTQGFVDDGADAGADLIKDLVGVGVQRELGLS